MDQVAVNINQWRFSGRLTNDVSVPDFAIHGARSHVSAPHFTRAAEIRNPSRLGVWGAGAGREHGDDGSGCPPRTRRPGPPGPRPGPGRGTTISGFFQPVF